MDRYVVWIVTLDRYVVWIQSVPSVSGEGSHYISAWIFCFVCRQSCWRGMPCGQDSAGEGGGRPATGEYHKAWHKTGSCWAIINFSSFFLVLVITTKKRTKGKKR